MSFATPPPVMQPPRKNDTLLRNVLIAVGFVCFVVFGGAIYLGYRIYLTAFREFEEVQGRKQVVRRELANGWKVVHLAGPDWTVEVPSDVFSIETAFDSTEDPDATVYFYYSFDAKGARGFIESTTYREEYDWDTEELVEYDREELVDHALAKDFKSKVVEHSTGAAPAFEMTYQYQDFEGRWLGCKVIYWQDARHLHSIELIYNREDSKQNEAAFRRIWKSLKPPILATRSPSG